MQQLNQVSDIYRADKSLRPYQQKAKKDIFTAWDECDSVMFQMPTGTGKTRLFTSIISDVKTWGVLNAKDVKILIIAHRVELIEQISESLDKYKVSHGIIAGGKDRDLSHQVQVASIQTLTHRTNAGVAEALNVDFVIIDEAHHSVANSYRKLWQWYPDAKKLGVTATPWRMNLAGFRSLYDKLILTPSIKEFIKDGWLAPYLYYSVSNNSNIQKRIDSIDEFDIEGDYKTSALEREMDNTQIRAQLLDSYLKLAKGKKGIIYSISRAHSDHICNEYREAGINIVRIDSETPRDERRLYVKRFRTGQIDIIVNVDIFSEGFDCPDIEFIQLARPTKSLVKYLQQVGRGLRPTAGKTKCLILDNVGLHNSFNLPDSERPWEEYFEGEERKPKRRSNRTETIERAPAEHNLQEGNDQLTLVEDASSGVDIVEAEAPQELEKVQWAEADDSLLTRLVTEKACPIELLEQIFKKDSLKIEERIIELGLNSDSENQE